MADQESDSGVHPLVAAGEMMVVPGVYDVLSAKLAERAGFPVVVLTGYGVAASYLGEPDFGLYTANQFQRAKDTEPLPGQLPERGVVEVKSWKDDSFLTARSNQVTRYWKKYRLVLVTNYRDFVLVGSEEGKPVRLEGFRLAESEAGFRAAMAQPRKTASEQGERLVEFLRRVMLHAAPLAGYNKIFKEYGDYFFWCGFVFLVYALLYTKQAWKKSG